jgi:hypothetical protein
VAACIRANIGLPASKVRDMAREGGTCGAWAQESQRRRRVKVVELEARQMEGVCRFETVSGTGRRIV